MGCHSGSAVSDTTVGGRRGGGRPRLPRSPRAAPRTSRRTGFGYGDQVSIGLQERLMTLFAGQLDGAVSLGDALRNAKQQYFAGQGLYGAYDEKALSSTILYGLPMFADRHRAAGPADPAERDRRAHVGADRPVVACLRRELHVRRSHAATSGAGSRPMPATARSCRRSPRAGRSSRAAELDVTAAAADNSLLPAHGAVVSGAPHRSDRHRLRRGVQSPDARQRGRASPRRSTPSPPSRRGWRASPPPATPRAWSVPTGSPNVRSWC